MDTTEKMKIGQSIIEIMKTEQKRLERSVSKREKIIRTYPDGALHCYTNGKYYSWYVFKDEGAGDDIKKTHTLIPKTDRELAVRLAKKGYNEHALKIEKAELKAITAFIKHYPKSAPGQDYLENCDEHKRLLGPKFVKINYTEEQWKWMNAERRWPQPHPEKLTVPTILGFNVRSKSESEIVTSLATRGIAFRYEWPLFLKDDPYPKFPDFTIQDPSSGGEVIYEHLGIMDDETYRRDSAEKIKNYIINGYFPGVDLFLSYETSGRKFTSLDADSFVAGAFADPFNKGN